METKFKQAVYDTGKTLAELSREYAHENGMTEEASYMIGIRYFNGGVWNYTTSAINWAYLLGKSYAEIKEDKVKKSVDTKE